MRARFEHKLVVEVKEIMTGIFSLQHTEYVSYAEKMKGGDASQMNIRYAHKYLRGCELMTGAYVQREAGNANQRRNYRPQQPHHRVHEHIFSQELDFLFKNSID